MEEEYENQELSEQTEEVTKANGRELLMILIQVGVCVVCIAAVLAIKLVGGAVYAQTATWFFERYNNSILTNNGDGQMPFVSEVSVQENSLLNEAADQTQSQQQTSAADPEMTAPGPGASEQTENAAAEN